MTKREEVRERQQREQSRNRILVILVVVMGALVVALALVLPNLIAPIVKTVVQITPATQTTPVSQITPSTQTKPASETSKGNPAASVKMDVWEDFQCSGCLYYTQNIEPQIFKTYVDTGKVYYNFHFFPFIDGGKGESHQAANAAMCASAQGHFWDYHDTLFANWLGENAGSYTNERLVTFAKNIGLDMTAFNQCFEANTYSAQIQQDADAGAKLGVPPTPGIFVNGKMVVNSAGGNFIPLFDDISRAIDAALGGAK